MVQVAVVVVAVVVSPVVAERVEVDVVVLEMVAVVAVEKGSDWSVGSVPLEHFAMKPNAVDIVAVADIVSAYEPVAMVAKDLHCGAY